MKKHMLKRHNKERKKTMIIDTIKDKKREIEIKKKVRDKFRFDSLVSDALGTFDDSLKEMDQWKKQLIKEAVSFKRESFDDGYRATLMNYKKVHFNQCRTKICRQHFKLFVQDAKLLGISTSHANALSSVSEYMLKMSRGAAKPAEVMEQLEIASDKSKAAIRLTEKLNEMIEQSYNDINNGFTQKDDEEIDEMFKNFLTADEAGRDITEHELSQKIENHLKNLDANI